MWLRLVISLSGYEHHALKWSLTILFPRESSYLVSKNNTSIYPDLQAAYVDWTQIREFIIRTTYININDKNDK